MGMRGAVVSETPAAESRRLLGSQAPSGLAPGTVPWSFELRVVAVRRSPSTRCLAGVVRHGELGDGAVSVRLLTPFGTPLRRAGGQPRRGFETQ